MVEEKGFADDWAKGFAKDGAAKTDEMSPGVLDAKDGVWEANKLEEVEEKGLEPG